MEPDQALEVSTRLNTALDAMRAALAIEEDPDLRLAHDHLVRYLKRLAGLGDEP